VAPLCDFDHAGCHVDSGRSRAALGRGRRGIAGPASNVHDAQSGLHAGCIEQRIDGLPRDRAPDAVRTGRPRASSRPPRIGRRRARRSPSWAEDTTILALGGDFH